MTNSEDDGPEHAPKIDEDLAPADTALSGPCARETLTKKGLPVALHAYKFRKGGPNPHALSRYYYECREIFKKASPELARAAIELALDPETDQRVRSVLIVAGLDRTGVKPIDHDPSEDDPQPTWDPGALDDEEREQLKALLVKMVGKK